jgi:pyruvate formate lyase activating enzyme
VDLKSFDDRQYRKLGGRLQPVLDTIAALHARGIWVELVTLLVPGLNDSDDELRQLTGFIRDVSPDIPWHVTAFHADYPMDERPATTPAAIVRAAGLGRDNGLRFVYAGNLPGHVGHLEDTRCPGCALTLVERSGYRLGAMRITAEGGCPRCHRPVPGRWNAARS